jgi:hypothetical protein
MGERVRLFVPKQAVGSNLVYFDLFNASTSGQQVIVHWCEPIASGAAAHTGVLSADLFLTFTSAIGTGGTGATVRGTALDAMTFSGNSSRGGAAVPTGITARLTPSGGATAAAVISWTTIFTEETGAGTYERGNDLVHENEEGPVLVLPGAGIRVVQGTIAATGNIGFNLGLEFVPFF